MRKNLYRSIWKSLGRYLAIVAIIAGFPKPHGEITEDAGEIG